VIQTGVSTRDRTHRKPAGDPRPYGRPDDRHDWDDVRRHGPCRHGPCRHGPCRHGPCRHGPCRHGQPHGTRGRLRGCRGHAGCTDASWHAGRTVARHQPGGGPTERDRCRSGPPERADERQHADVHKRRLLAAASSGVRGTLGADTDVLSLRGTAQGRSRPPIGGLTVVFDSLTAKSWSWCMKFALRAIFHMPRCDPTARQRPDAGVSQGPRRPPRAASASVRVWTGTRRSRPRSPDRDIPGGRAR
jgi:hypothetical protein